MSKVVTLNIPRGGGPAPACFRPTKHDLGRVTPTCLTSQRFEARSHELMGVVWHTGPTPLIYPLLEFTSSSQKVERVMSHDWLLVSAAACSGAATEYDWGEMSRWLSTEITKVKKQMLHLRTFVKCFSFSTAFLLCLVILRKQPMKWEH